MAGGLKETVTWRDAKGNTARTSFFVANAGTAITEAAASDAITTPLAALTNCVNAGQTGPRTNPKTEVVYGTAATYATVEDKVVFTFQTATGDIHRMQVPAPIEAIFLADGETVDPANTLVVAFSSAFIANAVSQNGEAITFGAFGTRIRRKIHRKGTNFTKNPALTGPGL